MSFYWSIHSCILKAGVRLQYLVQLSRWHWSFEFLDFSKSFKCCSSHTYIHTYILVGCPFINDAQLKKNSIASFLLVQTYIVRFLCAHTNIYPWTNATRNVSHVFWIVMRQGRTHLYLNHMGENWLIRHTMRVKEEIRERLLHACIHRMIYPFFIRGMSVQVVWSD